MLQTNYIFNFKTPKNFHKQVSLSLIGLKTMSLLFRDEYQNILAFAQKLCKQKLSYCTHCNHILNRLEKIINIEISTLLLLNHTFVHDLLLLFGVRSYHNLATKFPQRRKHSCFSIEFVAPQQEIEPRSPVLQAGILSTVLQILDVLRKKIFFLCLRLLKKTIPIIQHTPKH